MKLNFTLPLFAFTSFAALVLPAYAQQKINLVPDASFEAPAPAWFDEMGGNNYSLTKNQQDGAPDGTHVLELRTWSERGTKVLSPAFDVPAGAVTLTVAVRALNPVAGSKLAVALLDANGKKEIARFGEMTLTDATQWKILSGSVTTPGGKMVLALLPSGAAGGPADNDTGGSVIQLDQLGLFAGTTAGPVSDNVDWQVTEAESLANGTSWTVRPHVANWYHGLPSGGKMLTGANKVKADQDAPVTAAFTINNAGPHVLWVRFLYTGRYKGDFTATILQNGKTVAQRTIASNDATIAPKTKPLTWVWVPLQADLATGTATVQLSRPANGTTWLARDIDVLLLTNLMNYQANIADLQPQLFVRWTNTGSGAPYCLWTWVHRSRAPWYANAGMLSATGFNQGYSVPPDQSKWIGPGQSSPWSNISPYLLPDGPFNRVLFTATRKAHTSGFVDGPIKGTLEFALGAEKKVFKTITFNQDAPRVRLAIPGDTSQPVEIQTGYDFLQKEQAAVTPAGGPQTAAKYLDLVTILNLQSGMDDPALIDGEVKNLVRMGFNGTYYVLNDDAHPENTVAFYRAHNMQTHFGIGGGTWDMTQDHDITQPDIAGMDQKYLALATSDAAFLPQVVRMKLADEPGGISYEVLAKSPVAQQKFRAYLQQQNVTPADLGATSWEQVFPITEGEKAEKPKLFYYSALFRLQAAADLAKTVVTEKKKYFPDSVKTYVNYSPPFSWVLRGADPFLMQRNGGLEMGWTEDWLGYSAGPEYTSDTYALLRAAGQGQPLGGYMVGKSGNALLQRIKYYTMVAGGAREISVYNYGPEYAGVDSWSRKYDIYPVIRDVQFELGNIDDALHGTQRRPAKIAILYNRTAAIWGGADSTAEQDARDIRWAVTHAGYDANIIPEEDIAAGKLDQYKVLYMDGIQLRRDAADKIAAWVHNGGVLLGGAGAGTRDEFNQPLATMENVFGAKSLNLKTVGDAGRPKYELRKLAVLDTLQSGDSATQFDQLCYSETLQPGATAKVLFKDKAGNVTGTQNSVGAGTAIRLAALPGLAYLNHAVRGAEYDPDTYLPQNYDAAQRAFLSLPARLANVPQVAQSNLDIPEITRYDAPGRSVIFVINEAGSKKADFSMLLPDASWATKAYCADGAKVTLSKEANGMTRVSFALNVAGAVVLEK